MYRAHTFPEGTKSTYRTYRDSYFQFCQFTGYPPVPATTSAICQYAAFLARSLKTPSIRQYVGVIGLLHKEFGLPNPLLENWALSSLMKGIKRIKGDKVSQKLPITPELLIGVHSKLNTWHSFDASFWAICLTAFYGLFRKSHLLSTSHKSFDPSRQFTKQDFVFFPWGMLLSVRWSKTIQFREREVQIPIPYIPNSVLCPCRAIAAAFAFTKHGEIACMHFPG